MRRVSFFVMEPSEQEYFEEYDKYTKSWWFILVFIFRSFSAFCLALQLTPFRHPEGMKIFMKAFGITNDSTFCIPKQDNSSSFLEKMDVKLEGVCKEYLTQMIEFKCSGYIVGGILGGILGDLRYGRRKTSLFSCFIWVISSWCLVFTDNIILTKLLYFIVFITCSIVFTVSFVNLAEIINRKNRFLIVFTNSTYILANSVSYTINQGFAIWKYLLAFIAMINSIMILCCWYIPESPRWLLNNNKKTEAYKQLNDISGLIYDIVEYNPTIHKRSKMKTFFKMFAFLFRNTKKRFLVLNMLMAITCFNYNNAKTKAFFASFKTREYVSVILTSEAAGYLLFIPLYIFLGYRYSLLTTFIAASAEFFIAFFYFSEKDEFYYNVFYILFSITALNFNLLFYLDLFPTFLRATVLGFGIFLFGLTKMFSIYFGFAFRDNSITYSLTCFFLNICGVIVLMLPESAHQELINTKLE